MQRCGLVWPVEKLGAEYLDGVWLQKVNYTRTSIAAGALWANIEQKKDPWPVGEADQAVSDADPPSMRAFHGTDYRTMEPKEGP